MRIKSIEWCAFPLLWMSRSDRPVLYSMLLKSEKKPAQVRKENANAPQESPLAGYSETICLLRLEVNSGGQIDSPWGDLLLHGNWHKTMDRYLNGSPLIHQPSRSHPTAVERFQSVSSIINRETDEWDRKQILHRWNEEIAKKILARERPLSNQSVFTRGNWLLFGIWLVKLCLPWRALK